MEAKPKAKAKVTARRKRRRKRKKRKSQRPRDFSDATFPFGFIGVRQRQKSPKSPKGPEAPGPQLCAALVQRSWGPGHNSASAHGSGDMNEEEDGTPRSRTRKMNERRRGSTVRYFDPIMLDKPTACCQWSTTSS